SVAVTSTSARTGTTSKTAFPRASVAYQGEFRATQESQHIIRNYGCRETCWRLIAAMIVPRRPDVCDCTILRWLNCGCRHTTAGGQNEQAAVPKKIAARFKNCIDASRKCVVGVEYIG